MRTLIYYYNWYLDGVISAAVLDDMLEQSRAASIVVLACDGELRPCWTNRTSLKSICSQCRFYRKHTLRIVGKGLQEFHLSELASWCTNEDPVESFEYTDVPSIKRLRYKGVPIGYGALSSYISWTRNHEPVIDSDFRSFFNVLLRQQVLLTEAFGRMLDQVRPDEVAIFNGRTADVRPVFETAIQRQIPIRVIENMRIGKYEFSRVVYRNVLPHDVAMRTREIERVWRESPLPPEERERIAAEFFERRRRGVLTRDKRVYTAKQRAGLLPAEWDASRRSIVIFLSSEDEIAAVGDESEKYNLFPSQEIGIRKILELTAGTDVRVYLRIHPNLAGVDYGYHKRLYNLAAEFPGLVVVGADSPVSSYAMLDAADTVVVFSSSMGVEACFWGKPVILLGRAYYYHLGVAYVPKSVQELGNLLCVPLEALPAVGAFKFAYYLMDVSSYSVRVKYGPRPVLVVGGKTLTILTHLRLMRSSLLFRLYAHLRARLVRGVNHLLGREAVRPIPRAGA